MSAPSHSTHYVSKGAGVVLYPGGGRCTSTGAPIYACADCSLDATGHYVRDNVSTWTGVQVGDLICFDINGTRERSRIDSMGLDPDDEEDATYIHLAVGIGTGASANKAANVGGAFGSIQQARATVLNDATFRNAAGDPLRIGIPAGVTFNEAVNDTGLPAGTSQYPITIQAYSGTPDSPTWPDWTTDAANRAKVWPLGGTGTALLTITAATNATQAVLTVGASHNFQAGQTVKLASMGGSGGGTAWSTANGTQTIVAVGATTITLALNTSAYQTYTASSGTASPFTGTVLACWYLNATSFLAFAGIDCQSAYAASYGWYFNGTCAMTRVENCRAQAPYGGFFVQGTGLTNAIIRRNLFENGGNTGTAGQGQVFLQNGSTGLFEFNVVRGSTGGASGVSHGGGWQISENLIIGNSEAGIFQQRTSSWTAHEICYNTIADNAHSGVDLGNQTTLELVALHDNLIAHNGTSDTATITHADPAVVTAAATDFADKRPVKLSTTGTLPAPLEAGHVYFLYRTGAKTYNLYDTLANATAHGATGRVATTTDGDGVHTVLGGFNVKCDLIETGHLPGLLEWNSLYAGVAGDILASGGAAHGTVCLIDNSLHDDSANAPFVDATAANRVTNAYRLSAAAKQVRQYHADTAYNSYVDLGAQQCVVDYPANDQVLADVTSFHNGEQAGSYRGGATACPPVSL